MRICFMAHAGSVHTQRYVAYFAAQGHECHVISFTAGELAHAAVHCLPSRHPVSAEGGNWQHLLQCPRVGKLLREIRPDVINAHFATSYGTVAALANRGRVPVVVTAYGSDVLTLPRRHPGYMFFTRLALRSATSIISMADHITMRLRQWLGPGKPILTCQYGIDIGLFHPTPAAEADPAAVLCNRAWVRNSNIPVLLRALARLKRQHCRMRLTLLAGGPMEDELTAQVQALGISDRVALVGRVAPAAMPGHLRQHAIWVSITSSDGWPLSLYEAMACGAFPVVSDIAAYRGHIEHGKNGFLVDPTDDATLAARLAEAMENPELRRAAAERNWSMVQARADYRKNMPRIEAHLCHVANDSCESST